MSEGLDSVLLLLCLGFLGASGRAFTPEIEPHKVMALVFKTKGLTVVLWPQSRVQSAKLLLWTSESSGALEDILISAHWRSDGRNLQSPIPVTIIRITESVIQATEAARAAVETIEPVDCTGRSVVSVEIWCWSLR